LRVINFGIAKTKRKLGELEIESGMDSKYFYEESQFKTLKYCPGFPGGFGSIQDPRAFCKRFFTWYNQEHYHSGIALMTPANVHYGMAQNICESRVEVLKSAFDFNPKRFKGKVPKPPALPKAAWINKPETGSVLYD